MAMHEMAQAISMLEAFGEACIDRSWSGEMQSDVLQPPSGQTGGRRWSADRRRVRGEGLIAGRHHPSSDD